MIPSATTASFFHRGNAHGESTVLVELADDMALGPPIHWIPIHWIILLVVDVIGLEPLINLLDGLWLRWWGAVFIILLLLVPLEALLWRQFSWMKASLLFVFHFSVLFQLIVRCIVLLLHRLPRFFLVSPSIPFFPFPFGFAI